MLTSMRAIVSKDLLVSRRAPTFLALGVVVPVMFVLLYAFIVQTATTAPIGFAVQSQGPHTEQFMSIIEDMRSEDGPAWEIRTTDPAEARKMYDSGETIGMVVIPPDFESNVSAGHAKIDIVSQNINSDITKNLQLRVDTAIGVMQEKIDPQHAVQFQTQDRWKSAMSFTRYMGASLLMFAILYSSMVNTGSLVAREWEDRTAKAVVLSPRGLAPLIAGKWLAAFIQTFFTMIIVALTLWLTLDYPILELGPASWPPLLLMFLYGSALGVLLGVTLRRSLPLVPVAAVLSVVHFLLVGFESYMRGYAHGGLAEFLWQLARFWPVSGAIDQIRFTVEGLEPFYIDSQKHSLLWLSAVIVVLIGTAVTVLRKRLRFTQGQ